MYYTIVAHNASFDMNFLSNTLERLGFSGKLYYLDTLDLARRYLSLPNNKQTTIAEYFNIPIGNAHRASDDALVCGKILVNIINLLKCVLPVVFSLVVVRGFAGYGSKVSDLLKNTIAKDSYAAMGIAVVYLTVSVIVLLITIIFTIKSSLH